MDHATVRALAERVKRSPIFHVAAGNAHASGSPKDDRYLVDVANPGEQRRPGQVADSFHLSRLLDLYVDKYPVSPTEKEILTAVHSEKADEPSRVAVELNRLRDTLNACFARDRDLWNEQVRFVIPLKAKNQPFLPLELAPLSQVLKVTEQFWFYQALNMRLRPKNKKTFLVYSEPLFFFCEPLRAYIRFLDVNHPRLIKDNDVDVLNNLAKEQLKTHVVDKFKKNDATRRELERLIEELPLVPVRHYLPAGDAHAARAIRHWFRSHFNEEPIYSEVGEVNEFDSVLANLIVLGHNRNVIMVKDFQDRHPELKLFLTGRGISCNGKELDDEVGREGVSKSRVIVTHWVESGLNVHTIVAGHHTRAVQSVVKLLLDEERLKASIGSLLASSARIPTRFQFAFEVKLELHETDASDPVLLEELDPGLVIY